MRSLILALIVCFAATTVVEAACGSKAGRAGIFAKFRARHGR